jgi:hypothetical protein
VWRPLWEMTWRCVRVAMLVSVVVVVAVVFTALEIEPRALWASMLLHELHSQPQMLFWTDFFFFFFGGGTEWGLNSFLKWTLTWHPVCWQKWVQNIPKMRQQSWLWHCERTLLPHNFWGLALPEKDLMGARWRVKPTKAQREDKRDDNLAHTWRCHTSTAPLRDRSCSHPPGTGVLSVLSVPTPHYSGLWSGTVGMDSRPSRLGHRGDPHWDLPGRGEGDPKASPLALHLMLTLTFNVGFFCYFVMFFHNECFFFLRFNQQKMVNSTSMWHLSVAVLGILWKLKEYNSEFSGVPK